MHTPEFQKLEGTWRGLNYLVMNSETSAQLKLKVLNVSKRDLFKDLDRAVEFDQSQVFKKLYENEFGTPGGEPYGALIGDYEFTNHPEDIDLLSKMSNVAAAAFCPFISAAAPALVRLRELHRAVQAARPGEDLRHDRVHQVEVVPRLARIRASWCWRCRACCPGCPTARTPSRSRSSTSRRSRWTRKGKAKPVPHEHYCWMNAAYVMGTRLTDAFAKYGFCTAIRGAEGGGKVEGLPAHVFTSDDGDADLKCPTEIGITDRREAELSKLGFLPLCHYKNTDYAVFFGAQTTQKPKKYDRPEATANAAISARLPYIMATSRFAHYLKVIARDKIGSFMEVEDCQNWLERWIANYVSADPKPSPEVKARYPLRGGQDRGAGGSRRARQLQRRGLAAALAADGGVDDFVADGGPDSPTAEVTPTDRAMSDGAARVAIASVGDHGTRALPMHRRTVDQSRRHAWAIRCFAGGRLALGASRRRCRRRMDRDARGRRGRRRGRRAPAWTSSSASRRRGRPCCDGWLGPARASAARPRTQIVRLLGRDIARLDALLDRPGQRHPAPPAFPETGGLLARAALPGRAGGRGRERQDPRAERFVERACPRSRAGHRVRPEPVVPQGLQRRVRHARRRAVRPAAGRLRDPAASLGRAPRRRRGRAGGDFAGGGRGLRPVRGRRPSRRCSGWTVRRDWSSR